MIRLVLNIHLNNARNFSVDIERVHRVIKNVTTGALRKQI